MHNNLFLAFLFYVMLFATSATGTTGVLASRSVTALSTCIKGNGAVGVLNVVSRGFSPVGSGRAILIVSAKEYTATLAQLRCAGGYYRPYRLEGTNQHVLLRSVRSSDRIIGYMQGTWQRVELGSQDY